MLSTNALRLNIFSLFLLCLVLFFPVGSGDEWLLRIVKEAILLWNILPLLGINLSLLIAYLSEKNFSWREFFTLSIISSIFFAPFVLVLEFSLLKEVHDWYAIANSAILASIVILISRRRKSADILNLTTSNPLQAIRSLTLTREEIYTFFLGIVFIFLIVTRYYTLPDSDPDHWLTLIRTLFANGQLIPLSGDRPFFTALAYIFTISAGIDMYAYFKYLLPFSLLIPLIPAALTATLVRFQTTQLFLLFIPLAANASFILYSTTPIPQAFLNSLLLSATYLLGYAFLKKDVYFSFLGGFALLTAAFYHEFGILFLLLWLSISGFIERSRILQLIKKNRFAAICLAVILIRELPSFSPQLIIFLQYWIIQLYHLVLSSGTNFMFPAEYVNIDGNPMGWGFGIGLIKYYSFYAGGTFFLAVIFIIINKNYWKLLAEWFQNSFLIVIVFFFFCLIAIAEIFPRFFNVALLPERALSMAVPLFLILFGVTILDATPLHRVSRFLLIGSFSITLCGAYYVNNSKQFLITPEQFASIEWIKQQLPQNRIILSYNQKNFLKVFSGTNNVFSVPDPDFFYEKKVYETDLRNFLDQKFFVSEEIRKKISSISSSAGSLAYISPEKNKLLYLNQITILKQSLKDTEILVNQSDDTNDLQSNSVYIYFAEPNQKNPYLHRPYNQDERLTEHRPFYFDFHPDIFERVYSTADDRVVIWRIISFSDL